jgi:hypothetical protein
MSDYPKTCYKLFSNIQSPAAAPKDAPRRPQLSVLPQFPYKIICPAVPREGLMWGAIVLD